MARSINRKSAFLASLALSVSAMTVYAANAAEITVMGYRGAFQDNYVKAVIEPFQKEHPDIKVTYYGVQNAATSLGNMRAQKSSPQTDAVIYDLSVAKIADEEGLVEKLDPASLKIMRMSPILARNSLALQYRLHMTRFRFFIITMHLRRVHRIAGKRSGTSSKAARSSSRRRAAAISSHPADDHREPSRW